jgi:hypothetical protein
MLAERCTDYVPDNQYGCSEVDAGLCYVSHGIHSSKSGITRDGFPAMPLQPTGP